MLLLRKLILVISVGSALAATTLVPANSDDKLSHEGGVQYTIEATKRVEDSYDTDEIHTNTTSKTSKNIESQQDGLKRTTGVQLERSSTRQRSTTGTDTELGRQRNEVNQMESSTTYKGTEEESKETPTETLQSEIKINGGKSETKRDQSTVLELPNGDLTTGENQHELNKTQHTSGTRDHIVKKGAETLTYKGAMEEDTTGTASEI